MTGSVTATMVLDVSSSKSPVRHQKSSYHFNYHSSCLLRPGMIRLAFGLLGKHHFLRQVLFRLLSLHKKSLYITSITQSDIEDTEEQMFKQEDRHFVDQYNWDWNQIAETEGAVYRRKILQPGTVCTSCNILTTYIYLYQLFRFSSRGSMTGSCNQFGCSQPSCEPRALQPWQAA